MECISDEWLIQCKKWVLDYLKNVDWKIDENSTLKYCNNIRNNYSITSYRKRIYQILKLLQHLKVDWVDRIKLPSEPNTIPKSVTTRLIQDTLSSFQSNRYNIQCKAMVLLGATSGIRAEELYQLTTKDININNRSVSIIHDIANGKTTKTRQSRVVYFNQEAKMALTEYLYDFDNTNSLRALFSQKHILRLFKDAPIQVKDLRKFYSQEWDRRGGPTSIKKMLMGHSLNGDVDLMHYNYQTKDDLKNIYDKVMGDLRLVG